MNTEQETLFQENAGRTARLLIYGLVAIIMMAADHRGQYLEQLRAWGAHLLIPVYETVGLPFHGLEQAGLYFQRQNDLQEQLQQLQQDNLHLRAQSLLVEKLRRDNDQLRELLGAQRERALRMVYTELVRIDLDPYSHRVVIDRGSNHGVALGQAVMDANGIFGQVERVSVGGAEVILISDPNHALPVQVNRTGMRTLAYGTGNPNQLVLPDLPLNTDIRQGDRIVTSGLGGHFPPGLPVAIVLHVEEGSRGDFTRAVARPLAGLSRSTKLLVLLSPEQQSDTRQEPATDEPNTQPGSPQSDGGRSDDGQSGGGQTDSAQSRASDVTNNQQDSGDQRSDRTAANTATDHNNPAAVSGNTEQQR